MKDEERIVIGYKGEIGTAIGSIFEMTYGVEVGTKLPEKTGFRIVHVCIPFVDNYVDVVSEYINTLSPDFTIIHTTCKVGTTREIYERTKKPVVHCPVNGRHPIMKPDILRYGLFVGAIDESVGQMVCEYIERFNLQTYLCETPEITELSKIASTELIRTVVGFYQGYKKQVRSNGLNWAEFVAFFENIQRNAKDGMWVDRVFQRAGEVDAAISGKHCLSTNKELT